MCPGVVSVMSTLGFRAVWAMGERVGYGKTKFSFSVTAAAKIDPPETVAFDPEPVCVARVLASG